MTGTYTREETRQANALWRDNIMSDDPSRVKKAEDGIRGFIRKMLRESGFLDDILPGEKAEGRFDKDVHDPRPGYVLDIEPSSPAAISMAFASSTDDFYLRGDRYRLTFQHVETPEVQVDVGDLMTYDMDLRQVVVDNMTKDLSAEKDTVFISGCQFAVGSLGSTVSTSGTIQHKGIGGGFSRESIVESMKTLVDTPSNFPAAVGLVNHVTFLDVAKWNRMEWGGDAAETVAKRGVYSEEFKVKDNLFDLNWRVTIKKSLVATNEAWYFAKPNCLGKHAYLNEPMLFIERKKEVVRMSVYQRFGAVIVNTNGLVRIVY